MLQMIISAIQNREYLSFTYSGLPRVVQPAAVGVTRAGHYALRCYQVEGGHIHPGHEWDLCLLSGISGLSSTRKNFAGEPPGYRKGDKHLNPIYAEL